MSLSGFSRSLYETLAFLGETFSEHPLKEFERDIYPLGSPKLYSRYKQMGFVMLIVTILLILLLAGIV